MKKKFYLTLIISLSIFGISLITSYTKIKAASSNDNLVYNYPSFDVDIKINQDSTFDVTEKIDYEFYGTAHGLTRDLTLSDPRRDCSSGRTCGGFDRVEVISVVDNKGNDLSGKYTLNELSDNNGKRFMQFKWTIWPNGKFLNGDIVGWVLKYKIYGGIQKIGDFPYFYWNVLPEIRNGSTRKFNGRLSFPASVNLSESSFKVYSDYSPNIFSSSNNINLSLNNLDSFGNLTLSYQFNNNEITLPGKISYQITQPQLGSEIYLDGVKQNLNNSSVGALKSVPIGDHNISFRHSGYNEVNKNVGISSGEDKSLNISLEPTASTQILLLLNILLCISGIIFAPLGLLLVYFRYRTKGRDQEMPKTIIPLYSPPEGISPYLLGTLKDESIDKEDIVGSIIDLAYRGYIQIKEITKGSNFELTKLQGKKDDKGLDDVERTILDGLFGNGEIVETKDLKYSFPYKYNNIVNKISRLLVEKGFFKREPKQTISMYAGIGIALLFFGFIITVMFSLIYSGIIGYVSLFGPGLLLIFAGLGFTIAAKYMPAKTPLGSKVYADILGFKMYLTTAERLRLQNLGPDEFEKYLSYAIVFKIENQWAMKFQGIYNKVPDWYIGTGNVYDAIWISSFTRGFANSTISNITPVSSSSSNGSGWSGSSSSFGGFSGGGGGGGSSGAW